MTKKVWTTSEILMLVPNALAAGVDLIFCIPILGRILKWVWNSFLTLVHFLIGMLEYIFWKLNIRPMKKFRVGFLILRDSDQTPLTTPEAVLPAVHKAQDIFKQAHVEIIPAFPPPKKLSESGESFEKDLWTRTPSQRTVERLVEVECNLPAMLQDLGVVGTLFQYRTVGAFFESGFRRLTGYGAPVTVFVVQEIKGFAGCSLGWLSDYVTVEHDHLFTSAHELGHACNLLHRSDKSNLMHPSSGKQEIILLTDWQIALMRASRHITLL